MTSTASAGPASASVPRATATSSTCWNSCGRSTRLRERSAATPSRRADGGGLPRRRPAEGPRLRRRLGHAAETGCRVENSHSRPPHRQAPGRQAGAHSGAAQRLLGGPDKPAAAKSGPVPGPASLLDEELPPLPAGLPPLGGGSLDALMSDPGLAAAVEQGSPLAPLPPPKKSLFASLAERLRGGGRRRRSYMPWVWIGAAATALVVLVAVVVVWLVTGQDPNVLLVPADADYQNGAYAKAIEGYDKFLGRFPRHAASPRAGPPRPGRVAAEGGRAGGRGCRRRDRQTRRARRQCRGGIRRRGGPASRHPPPSDRRAAGLAGPRSSRPRPSPRPRRSSRWASATFLPRRSRWSGSAASRPPWRCRA